MSRRTERVASAIRQEVARILQTEMSDPRIKFVSVTLVEVAKDMRTTKVNVSFLGAEEDAEGAMRALEKARGHIQNAVGRNLKLRWTPEVTFRRDRGIANAMEIDRILTELASEREEEEETDAEHGP